MEISPTDIRLSSFYTANVRTHILNVTPSNNPLSVNIVIADDVEYEPGKYFALQKDIINLGNIFVKKGTPVTIESRNKIQAEPTIQFKNFLINGNCKFNSDYAKIYTTKSIMNTSCLKRPATVIETLEEPPAKQIATELDLAESEA